MIKTWIQKIKKFILSLKENFSNIKKEVSDETNKNAVSHIFKELKTLLHHIGPRRGKAQLSYSTGDPATTGELTGVLSIMPLFYKKGIPCGSGFYLGQVLYSGKLPGKRSFSGISSARHFYPGI